MPVRLEVGLYRIAQEALKNIAQHAHARRAEIELSIASGEVRLTITDDGQGFDPEQVPAGRFGLVGLNERVRLLDGSLRLESSPGSGTSIQVTVPHSGANQDNQ